MLITLVALAMQVAPIPDEDEIQTPEELEALDLADRIFRGRAYSALVHEEDLLREFRDYRAESHGPSSDQSGRIGDKVRLRASLAGDIGYDDNLFLTSGDKTSDTLSVVTATLRGTYESARTYADVKYVARERIYFEHSELTSMDHTVVAEAAYGGRTIEASIHYSFDRARDPIDTLVLQTHVERRMQSVAGSLFVKFDALRFEATGGYRWVDILQDLPNFFGFQGAHASLLAATPVAVRTQVFLEAARSTVEFDGPLLDDAATTTIAAGWRGRPVDKLLFTLKAGWTWIDVDEDSGRDPRQDTDDLLVVAAVVWRLRESTLITGGFQQEPVSTADRGELIHRRLHAGVQQWLAERWVGSASAYVDFGAPEDGGALDRRIYGVSLAIRYEPGTRWDLHATVDFRAGDFRDTDSSYENFRASLGCRWGW